eukprot:TRINITY_DN11508_c0_g1_i8.p1 TRINITY_DN11508_c0_g1~~TRINITY_DN11508_c0_g1_i8.p1  ORF type:complete len:235 (+),score=26.42 TRINITY_DN11508_c0_g1_i8:575-1279(+)
MRQRRLNSKAMMLLIGNVFIPKKGKDKRIWTASTNGIFSVASFFLTITKYAMTSHPHISSLWRMKAPPRVIEFGWSALLGGILTMDNLRRRRMLVVNACPMCLSDEETIAHLSLNCKTAQFIWKVTLGWFHCCGPLPQPLPALFEYWKMGVGSKRGNVESFILWHFCGAYVKKETKDAEGLSSTDNQLGERIKHLVAIWASPLTLFKGIAANAIFQNWTEIAFSHPHKPCIIYK